jgi:hypothetical protein
MLAAPQPVQSWSDAQHGWKAAGQGVEATTDGGHHWRLIFRYGPGGASDIDWVLQTSASAGLVGAVSTAFATADGGRHWYSVSSGVPIVSTLIFDNAVGQGAFLFELDESRVLQAAQWPLRGLTCRGKWFHQLAGGLSDYGPKPRTICLEGPGVAVRTRTVYSAPNGDSIVKPTLIPGGLVAGVYDTRAVPDRLVGELVYRDGVSSVHPVPGADGAYAFVRWPSIALIGGPVTWTSGDGGDTWTSSR